VALLVGVSARVAAAQQPANCTYVTCALRMHYSFFGSDRVVVGETGVYADGEGFFSNRIPAFETGSDQVRFHYVEYRSHAKRSMLLGFFGAVLVGVGASVDYDASDGNKAAKISLISSGVIVGAIAAVNDARSRDHLQRAIWLYNRDLPR
jgi:hypothetical protein